MLVFKTQDGLLITAYSKLADWDDDEPSALPETSSRWNKVVVLKHMFTLAEIDVRIIPSPPRMGNRLTAEQEDPAAILDIKEDIRDECSKLGEITNVVLYDKEPDGVVTVRFSDPEAAKKCVEVSISLFSLCWSPTNLPLQVMGGRFFGGTQVVAYISDGSEKFKKTNEKRAALEDMAEGRDEEENRLDEFGSWLENPRDSERVVESFAR